MPFIIKWRLGGRFEIELLDDRPGLITFRAIGHHALSVFANESGGHRWQRIPPTERKGRVHTSTITVAVLEDKAFDNIHFSESDLKWEFTRGSGAGGQHKNKTDTCVRLTHLPTKMSVKIDGRSRPANEKKALETLRARVTMHYREQIAQDRDQDRKDQMGSGQRGDKVRTIRVRDNRVTNHLTNKKITFKKYAAGDLSGLFE